VAEACLWAVLLPMLAALSARAVRREPPGGPGRAWALLALGAALALRLLVTPMPSDVVPDVGLGALSVNPTHRLSAIVLLVWEVLAHLAKLGFTAWDGCIAVNILAGSLCVLVVQRLVWRLWEDRTAAFAAALIVACTPAAVRFSASESPSVPAMLFTALALDALAGALRDDGLWPLAAAAGWLAALCEVRPEGIALALAVLVFFGPRSLSLLHGRGRTAALIVTSALVLILPRLLLDCSAALSSDIMPPLDAGRMLAGVFSLPFYGVFGPLWGTLCAAAIAYDFWREPKAAAWRLAALFAATGALVSGFNPGNVRHATNLRYYLPALVLLSPTLARGLSALAERLCGTAPRSRMIFAAAVVLAAPLQSWSLLWTHWAPQEEFAFVRRQLAGIADGCVIYVREPERVGALEPSTRLSAAVGRVHDWRRSRPDEPMSPAPGCALYYRGGRCALSRWSVDAGSVADDCGRLERGWQFVPVAEVQVSGLPLVSESYRSDPYTVGFYRFSRKKEEGGRLIP
jgi:hypothetical protein